LTHFFRVNLPDRLLSRFSVPLLPVRQFADENHPLFQQQRTRLERVVQLINPIVRGWVNYFAIGAASRCFGFIKDWVEKKVRRHLMRARNRQGFGWKRWSRRWLYDELGLFNDYQVRHPGSMPTALPAR
jgi:RNA-directed DNA polymerase